MRIAFRRPDGAWYFADSRTPFTPAGVTEIDILPSNTTSSTSLSSSCHLKIPSNKQRESNAARDLYKGCDPEFGFLHEPTPPTYREWCDERSDGPWIDGLSYSPSLFFSPWATFIGFVDIEYSTFLSAIFFPSILNGCTAGPYSAYPFELQLILEITLAFITRHPTGSNCYHSR